MATPRTTSASRYAEKPRAAGVGQTLTAPGRGETQWLCEEETDECNARTGHVEIVNIH